MCRAVWCRPRRYGDPTTEYRISTSSVEKSYTRRLEPLWLYEIILSEHLFERYQAPLTRKARVAPHTEPVLILLPPSEKKAADPGAAIEVYTGVLYAALGWNTLSKAQQKLGQSCIVIISAKYGALRPHDPIEPYKEKIVNKEMAPKVASVLDALTPSLIIDCRSSTYQTVWQSPIEKTVEIKVFTTVEGQKKVITHMSKKTRGEVTRYLLQSAVVPQTPQQLYEILSQGFTCILIEATLKEPCVLEVYC